MNNYLLFSYVHFVLNNMHATDITYINYRETIIELSIKNIKI